MLRSDPGLPETVEEHQDKKKAALAGGLFVMMGKKDQTRPWAIMASATFLKPAMFAPTT